MKHYVSVCFACDSSDLSYLVGDMVETNTRYHLESVELVDIKVGITFDVVVNS